jgi:hypothetical protein
MRHVRTEHTALDTARVAYVICHDDRYRKIVTICCNVSEWWTTAEMACARWRL